MDHLTFQLGEIDESDYEDLLVCNVFVMLFAGFDTSSTFLSICSAYLAKNQDAQDKLFAEVQEAIEAEGSQHLGYTTVQGMKYLDMFVNGE